MEDVIGCSEYADIFLHMNEQVQGGLVFYLCFFQRCDIQDPGIMVNVLPIEIQNIIVNFPLWFPPKN